MCSWPAGDPGESVVWFRSESRQARDLRRVSVSVQVRRQDKTIVPVKAVGQEESPLTHPLFYSGLPLIRCPPALGRAVCFTQQLSQVFISSRHMLPDTPRMFDQMSGPLVAQSSAHITLLRTSLHYIKHSKPACLLQTFLTSQ